MGARSLGTGAWLLWLCISPRLRMHVLHVVCPSAETERGNGMRRSPPSRAGLPQCQLWGRRALATAHRIRHRLRCPATSELPALGQSWQGMEAREDRTCDAVPTGPVGTPRWPRHKANGILCLGRHHGAGGRLAGSCPPLSLLSAAALVADAYASGVESPVPPLSFLFSFFLSFFLPPSTPADLKKAQAVWAS